MVRSYRFFVLISCLFLLAGLTLFPNQSLALGPTDVSVTMTTAPFFVADSNSPPAADGPKAAYIGFEVCNTSGGLLTDLQIEMTDITGTVPGFALSGGQAAVQDIGTLQIAECQVYYWYVEYPYQDKDETGTFEVTVSDANPGTVVESDDVLTRNSISASAGGQVLSTTLGPGIFVGQIFYIDVVYEFGNIQNMDDLIFQPAGNLSFDASCYQLVSGEITASDLAGVGIPAGIQNQFYFVATGNQGGSSNDLTVRYYFRSLCVGQGTNAVPYAAQTSGSTNLKYTGNFDANTVMIPPSTNAIQLTKTATPNMIAVPPGVVTYTILVENTSDQFITIDRLDDVLPGSFAFNSLTVNSEVTATNSTSLPTAGDTGPIACIGNEPETFPYFSYLIAPLGTLTWEYTIDVPASTPDGNYQNLVSATMGNYTTQPVSASVGVGSCVVDIVCPVDITVNTDPGTCDATVSWMDATATGSCPPISILQTSGPVSGSTLPTGITTVEYTATDSDSPANSLSCTFDITVIDNENPTISCPMDMLVNSDPNSCGATVNYSVTGTDNCPGEVINQISGLPSGTFYEPGIYPHTFEIIDASGNSATCSFEIEVVDNISPQISCPPDLDLSTDIGQCGAIVTFVNPVGTDNCPGAITTQVQGLPSNTLYPIGVTVNEFDVIDTSGNGASCIFEVTVTDNESPMINCPTGITVNNNMGLCEAVVNYSVSFSDNCPGGNLMQVSGLPSGSSFPVGTTPNTYEATDDAGNTSTCSFNVTVIDSENPTINCPADITVNNEPGQCDSIVTFVLTAMDNCPGETISQTMGLSSGSAFPVGMTQNVFVVTDATGNTASCSFTVTVVDNENPTITCPASVVLDTDPGQCAAVFDYVVDRDDNCPGATAMQDEGLPSGSAFGVGTTTNSFTVTDASGNTAGCSFTVTVNDNEPPVANCPTDFTVSTDMGVCGATIDDINVAASDNCGIMTVTFDLTGATMGASPPTGINDASGTLFEVGVTTVTYTVTDDNGNVNTCSFNVTVEDNNDLSITCPGDVSVMTDPGNCSAVVNDIDPVVTDNCGVESVTYVLTGATMDASPPTGINDASGTTFEVGVTTVTYTVMDVNGNTLSCSFTVTVEDNNDLSVTCPGDVTVSNDSGQCGAVVIELAPVTTDNCGIASIVWTLSGATTGTGNDDVSGTFFEVGTTTVTYEATDVNGNMVSCSFMVTVTDDEDPTISCPMDILVNSDVDACGTVVDYSVTGTDNCFGATVNQTEGLADGEFFPVGVTTNTYVITDPSGNSATCSFDVEVVDNISPQITCPPDLVLDTDPGVCDAVVTFMVPIGTDNCPNPVTVQSMGIPTGGTYPLGLTINTFQVTDASGNTATCSFEVLVEDNEDPVLNCPVSFTVGTDPGQCDAIVNFSVTATDNCTGVMIDQISGIPSGNSYPIGMTSNTYEATDGSGNTVSCTFVVTVEDDENPMITCPGDITVDADPDACGTDNVMFSVTTSDNCPGEVLVQTEGLPSGAFFPIGVTTNTFEVTDANGNTATCSFNVTVEDNTNPVPDCPMDITVNTDAGICGAEVDYVVEFTDNCPDGMVVQLEGLPSGSEFPVGTTTNVFEFTDDAGNSVICTFDVTVLDDEDPTITCPTDISVDNEPGICSAEVTFDITGEDNCPDPVITQINGLPSGSNFPVGTTTNTFEISDDAGNTATCSFDVTVNDVEDPEITCPGDFTVGTDDDICGAVVDFTITVTDNCPGETLILDSPLGDGDEFPLGTTTVDYTLQDASGNMASCSFTVTVEDDTPPDLVCPGNITINLPPGACEGVVTFDVSTTDNCDPNPTLDQLSGSMLMSGDVFEIGTYDYEFESMDDAGNTSTCDFTITVDEFQNPNGTLACNDLITVPVDENGIGIITADMLLEGGLFGCLDDFILSDTMVTCDDIGNVVTITVTDPDTGNSCSTNVITEDNLPPEIECPTEPTVITCLEDPSLVPPPNAFDNCTDATVTLLSEMVIDDDACDDNMTVVVLTWIATDDFGNVSEPCEQIVELIRPAAGEIDFPDDVAWDCTLYDQFPNLTDATPLTGIPATSGSGIIGGVGGLLCGYSSAFTDDTIPDCGSTFYIVRTWTVVDLCTNQVITMNDAGEDNVQIISITDTTDPVVTLDDFTIGVNVPGTGQNDCTAQNFLPPPTVTDDCSDWQVFIFTPVGEAIYLNGVDGSEGGVIPPPGLGLGTHIITYEVVDDCSNVTQIQVEVTVVDDEAPTAICDEITNVTLTTNGEAIVPALVFDDGSYDNCSPVTFEVRRTDGDCDGEFDDFGPSVIFCCSDIPNNFISVTLRVYDAAGNFNDCEVLVEVEDKQAPVILECPADVTITCELYADEYAVPLNTGDSTVLNDFGEPQFFDNCDLEVAYEYSITLDMCQEGTIIRTWQATDPSGNMSSVCTQTIFIEHVSDWVVEFPADVTEECTDGQMPDLGEPEIYFDECELIGQSFEDEYFFVVQDACYKILRHYILINWCVYDEIGFDAYEEFPESFYGIDFDGDGDIDDRTFRDGWNTSGSPGDPDGYITYTQVIKINDTAAPTFTVPTINGCIEETDCITDITLPYPDIMDECATEFQVTIESDFGAWFDITGPVEVEDVVPGVYTIEYEVSDNCGNTAFETIELEVIDCKLPTPKCLNGLVVEIMQTQMIEVNAEALNLNSFDNCPGELTFSFSSDVDDDTVLYTCDDLGEQPVEIWVTDATGNQDFCETFIEVQDNMGFCTGNQSTVSVAGLIATEEDVPVEAVMVDVNGGQQTMWTAADGLYDFELPVGGDYSIVPMLDADPLNGVSTYDMVLISQHILGINLLDSPYQLIAADANNSGSVSTLDLVNIQKLILILEDEFPNNTSWRFVDAQYSFPDPLDPWQEAFPELVNYNDLTTDQLQTDFVAIKVGDVNGSAQPNSLQEVDNRISFGDLVLQTPAQDLRKGEATTIWFTGVDQYTLGWQFTMQADPNQVTVEEVLYGLAEADNFGTRFLNEGVLTASWHQSEPTLLTAGERIFGLRLRAHTAISLYEALAITSNYTGAEAYDEVGNLLQLDLRVGGVPMSSDEYALYQNVPNPFGDQTTIGFYLPRETDVRLVITDLSGRTVKQVKGDYSRGYQEITIDGLPGSGVYYYSLETAEFRATRKMVLR